MWNDLPLIREQLKAKLPVLLGEGDTVSIVWFSGRGEFGTLVKGEPVATLKDLSTLNKAIDRWLKPVCLTGFKEPLEEVERLVGELGGNCSLFFLSDGYDNQWQKDQILGAIQKLAPKCASTTFVEYGYYCNHPLMVAMAEEAGGQIIFNEDFKRYEPNFEAAMQKRAVGVKRVAVDLKADAIRGFAYALDNGSLLTFKVEGGQVKVPEHLGDIWFLSPAAVGEVLKTDLAEVDAAYAAIALYAQRVDSNVVLPLLKATGDVRFIKLFGGCFGKQKYAEFTEAATLAVFNQTQRLQEGCDPSAVPNDDAFTVLDLLRILASDGDNRLLLESKDFKYSKIGRAQKQDEELSEEDQKTVDALNERIAKSTSDSEIKKLQKEAMAIKLTAQPLKFEADPIPSGVTIDNLVFNETRPNVSVQVQRYGKVNIKARKPKEMSKIPDEVQTNIFRNYAIVRDGLLNVERLPLRLTGGTVRALREAGLPDSAILGVEGEEASLALARAKKASDEREVNLVLDLQSLPILNRKMVRSVSARELFELQYKLQTARAAQKVFNSYAKEDFGGKTSEGYKVLYGEEGAAWLKDQGLTDYGGFAPKTKQAAATDSYVGKELKVSLKGLATIPSLNDFNKRVADKKPLTPSLALMKTAVDAVEAFKGSDVYRKAKDSDAVFKAWLDGEQRAAKKEVRSLLYKVSQIRWSIIVGQTWFEEFSSLDENTLDITVAGETVTGTVELKEIEIPI
jgi:hypothetical protein